MENYLFLQNTSNTTVINRDIKHTKDKRNKGWDFRTSIIGNKRRFKNLKDKSVSPQLAWNSSVGILYVSSYRSTNSRTSGLRLMDPSEESRR